MDFSFHVGSMEPSGKQGHLSSPSFSGADGRGDGQEIGVDVFSGSDYPYAVVGLYVFIDYGNQGMPWVR